MRPEKLELTREEMRALGYLAIDIIVEHFDRLSSGPPGHVGYRPGLENSLSEPPPEEGVQPALLLPKLEQQVFQSIMHMDHPRFFGFVPGPSNFVGVIGDALASGFNAFSGTWFTGAGPTQIELITLDWLRQICGLPERAGGVFLSGGSSANLTALAAARQVRLGGPTPDAIVYYSDQTHSSVERALRILGFNPEQMRRIPSGQDFRLPLDALKKEVQSDRDAGRQPFCVVANAGTTATGAVDPIEDLAAFCRQEELWLHGDGAYGAAAMLTETGRRQLCGLQHVDSLSLDPHKWLFQPVEAGCVLFREERQLKQAFRLIPEYLRDLQPRDEDVNFCDRGVQLTRSFRAFKLWLTIKVFGLGALRQAVDWGLHLASLAAERIRQRPCFELVTPAQLAVVTFRFRVPGLADPEIDIINRGLITAILEDGYAIVTSTVLRGKTVLRLCTINPRTTEDEIEETLRRIEVLGGELLDQYGFRR